MESDDQSNNSETEHSTQGSDDIASNNTPTKLAFHFFPSVLLLYLLAGSYRLGLVRKAVSQK